MVFFCGNFGNLLFLENLDILFVFYFKCRFEGYNDMINVKGNWNLTKFVERLCEFGSKIEELE